MHIKIKHLFIILIFTLYTTPTFSKIYIEKIGPDFSHPWGVSVLNENELSDFFQLFNPKNSYASFDLSAQTKGILYWKHFIVLTLLFLGLEILLIRVIK